MDDIYNYQSFVIEYFFKIIKWVFNDFLINIKVIGIPVLYLFVAVYVSGMVISGLINTSKSSLGSSIPSSRKFFKKGD